MLITENKSLKMLTQQMAKLADLRQYWKRFHPAAETEIEYMDTLYSSLEADRARLLIKACKHRFVRGYCVKCHSMQTVGEVELVVAADGSYHLPDEA